MEKKLNEFINDFPLRERKTEIKVGVIAGGISSEREVSLSTGSGIHRALSSLGYNAEFIDFSGDLSRLIKPLDAVFIALHGKYGEDGTVQGLLELMKIPYTGSGVLASAAAMDKIFSKKIFRFENIPTPDFIPVDNTAEINCESLDREIKGRMGYPVIVKPNRGGSTIGVTVIEDAGLLESAVKSSFQHDSRILVEKYIKGRLLTVSIIGAEPVALPLIEIKPKSGFYDYASKYTPGLTDYLVPAPVSTETAGVISKMALKCHKMLDCSGVSRVDLIMDKSGGIHILEVNTIPGMTPTSLVPKAAMACGISFEELVDIILNCASLKL
ncbi:MAG: D-alanine--D-alanine ligase [Actinobacteria bacterium]|nr:D-alanine--D-alanine ligase [Actinomycetota bacterium]